MSLDKAIEHGKEKRKPYYGKKNDDPKCRNHGTDKAWVADRKFNSLKKELEASDKLKEVN
jgi:hypothetical protein